MSRESSAMKTVQGCTQIGWDVVRNGQVQNWEGNYYILIKKLHLEVRVITRNRMEEKDSSLS
jgi:hypothetical protein